MAARRRLSRLPLRWRLVAGFAATMLVLLTGAGAFVYWRVQFALDRDLNGSLTDASAALRPIVTPTGQLPADSATLARINGFQVVDRSGRVIDHIGLGTRPILNSATVHEAALGPLFRDIGAFLPAAARPLRIYATPVRAPVRSGSHTNASVNGMVLVVAIRRDQRDEALRELLAQLSAAGLVTLLLTSLVGGLLARAALRPVETYRRRASDIAAGAVALRLDVPPDRDDEITRLGHTLNNMLDALADALERERRFINDASHELRTPLTLLTSRVQLMLRRSRSVGQHEAALAEISEDLTRMTEMADELLELGTLQRPQAVGELVDASVVAANVIERRTMLAPAGTPYGATGSVSLTSSGPVFVDLDARTLTRVLENLLDNAALHGRLPVTVALDRVDGFARLMVVDAGEGMGPELLATATERFARSVEARTRPGSGLGLSLVATAVLGDGGQVRLCFAGNHHFVGAPIPVACAHGPEMTVTVFLPQSSPPPGP
jgi:two-component system OmpR family sensor kinase